MTNLKTQKNYATSPAVSEEKWRIFKRKKLVLNGVSMALASLTLLTAQSAMAGPQGGQITAGQGSISQSGLETNINQSSAQLDINWQDFSSAANETINFFQPDASSIAINRVVGGVPSQLNGALNANGNVFVLNSAGVAFGASSRVNVGSLLATTATDIVQSNGEYRFTGGAEGAVINQGQINVSSGGFALLVAPQVVNEGLIQANLGTIELASATEFTLDLRGDDLVKFAVTEEVLEEHGVSNTGTLRAQSGRIAVSANIASDVVASVVNLDGVIDADAFTVNDDGGVVLVTSTGLTNFNEDAIITARAGEESGDGGFVEVSGEGVNFRGTVDTTAQNGALGTLYIDPENIVIRDKAFNGDDVSDTVTTYLYEDDLELQASDVIIEADNSVVIENLADDVLNVAEGGINKSIEIRTRADGSITSDASDTIRTIHGDVILDTGSIDVGGIRTGVASIPDAGEVVLNARTGDVSVDNLEIVANGGDATARIDAAGDVFVRNIEINNIDDDANGDAGSVGNPVNAELFITAGGTVSGERVDVLSEAETGLAETVIVEYLNSGGAGFNNSFGFYYTDENGNPVSGELAYENLQELQEGDTLVLTQGGSDIGFFLLPDGERLNNAESGDAVEFRNIDGIWRVFSGGVELETRFRSNDNRRGFAFFSDSELNPNGDVYVIDSESEGNFNFEDLVLSERNLVNYNDANFNITFGQAETGEAHTNSGIYVDAGQGIEFSGLVRSNSNINNSGALAGVHETSAKSNIVFNSVGDVVLGSNLQSVVRINGAETSNVLADSNVTINTNVNFDTEAFGDVIFTNGGVASSAFAFAGDEAIEVVDLRSDASISIEAQGEVRFDSGRDSIVNIASASNTAQSGSNNIANSRVNIEAGVGNFAERADVTFGGDFESRSTGSSLLGDERNSASTEVFVSSQNNVTFLGDVDIVSGVGDGQGGEVSSGIVEADILLDIDAGQDVSFVDTTRIAASVDIDASGTEDATANTDVDINSGLIFTDGVYQQLGTVDVLAEVRIDGTENVAAPQAETAFNVNSSGDIFISDSLNVSTSAIDRFTGADLNGDVVSDVVLTLSGEGDVLIEAPVNARATAASEDLFDREGSTRSQREAIESSAFVDIEAGTLFVDANLIAEADSSNSTNQSYETSSESVISLTSNEGAVNVRDFFENGVSISSSALSNNQTEAEAEAETEVVVSAATDVLLQGSIENFAFGNTGAQSDIFVETGLVDGGDFVQEAGILLAAATTPSQEIDTFATIEVSVPVSQNLDLFAQAPFAVANQAEVSNIFSESDVDGSNVAELILRDAPAPINTPTPITPVPQNTPAPTQTPAPQNTPAPQPEPVVQTPQESIQPIVEVEPEIPVIENTEPAPEIVEVVEETEIVSDPVTSVLMSQEAGESTEIASNDAVLDDLAPEAGNNVDGTFCAVVNVDDSSLCQ